MPLIRARRHFLISELARCTNWTVKRSSRPSPKPAPLSPNCLIVDEIFSGSSTIYCRFFILEEREPEIPPRSVSPRSLRHSYQQVVLFRLVFFSSRIPRRAPEISISGGRNNNNYGRAPKVDARRRNGRAGKREVVRKVLLLRSWF